MIVVTGATGNIGRAVVDQLLARGEAVRAVVRGATPQLPGPVEQVTGDLSDPASVRTAFAGASAAFLLPGYPGTAEAARDCGVGRIVQLSGGSAGSGDQSNAVTRYMSRTEADVRATGVPWTFVRPVAFMSNALRWLPQLQSGDTVVAPFADVALACVHPDDVAAVATAALVEDGHTSMIYRPTGPEALLPAQQVAILADAIGRPLRFEAQSNRVARQTMLADTPPDYVAAFFDFYVNGSLDETTVRPTVRDVTGRDPKTFRDWVTANADRFRTA